MGLGVSAKMTSVRGTDHAVSSPMVEVDGRRDAQSTVDGDSARGQGWAKHPTSVTGSDGDVG